MSYSTFNGWQVIPMPVTPLPMQLDFEITDSVSVATSPFTQATQMQVWPGAEKWTCNVALPPMSRAKSDAWVAWFMSLQGVLNVFQMGDPSHTAPTGVIQGTPLVDGTSGGYNLPTSYFLYTKGWTASKTNLLLPGDLIQIGYRLHKVLQPVNSDANGKAQLNIWPSIREQPTDGQTLITSNCQGIWRLADPKRVWTERPTKLVGLSFKVQEAR